MPLQCWQGRRGYGLSWRTQAITFKQLLISRGKSIQW